MYKKNWKIFILLKHLRITRLECNYVFKVIMKHKIQLKNYEYNHIKFIIIFYLSIFHNFNLILIQYYYYFCFVLIFSH